MKNNNLKKSNKNHVCFIFHPALAVYLFTLKFIQGQKDEHKQSQFCSLVPVVLFELILFDQEAVQF